MIEKFKNQFDESWWKIIKPLLMDKRFNLILETLISCKFLPEINNIFKVFKETKFENIKVVFLGIDSSFSNDIINSLKEDFSEFNEWLFIDKSDLSHWGNQGVLMLNLALTYELDKPDSHLKLWKYFIEGVLKELDVPIVCFGEKSQLLVHCCNEQINIPHPTDVEFKTCGIFKKLSNQLKIEFI